MYMDTLNLRGTRWSSCLTTSLECKTQIHTHVHTCPRTDLQSKIMATRHLIFFFWWRDADPTDPPMAMPASAAYKLYKIACKILLQVAEWTKAWPFSKFVPCGQELWSSERHHLQLKLSRGVMEVDLLSTETCSVSLLLSLPASDLLYFSHFCLHTLLLFFTYSKAP